MSRERIFVFNRAVCPSRHQEMVCKRLLDSTLFGSMVGAARVLSRLAFAHGFASSHVRPSSFLKHLMVGGEGFNVAVHIPQLALALQVENLAPAQ